MQILHSICIFGFEKELEIRGEAEADSLLSAAEPLQFAAL